MSELKKTFGATGGSAMMLNTVLGAGLLILPGLAAKLVGALSFWVWLAAAAAAAPLLCVFAILAARFPDAGGIAHLAEVGFGRSAALATSFIFLGAVLLGLPSIALTGGYYLAAIFPVSANSAALVLLCVAGGLNLCAPDTAKKLGTLAAVCMSLLILSLIAASVFALHAQTAWQQIGANLAAIASPPMADAKTLSVVFFAVFFAFTGWEVALGMSGEFQNPKRNIPIAIGASFVIAVLLCLACSLTLLAAGRDAWHESAFVHILRPVFGEAVGALVALGVALLIAVNLFAAVWGVSRLVFALARNGALPRFVGELHAARPRNAVLLLLGALLAVTLIERISHLKVDNLLFFAGQNFFILYGVAAAVAVKKLSRAWEKIPAVFALLLVCALIVWSADWRGTGYPLILALIALGVSWRTRQ